MPRKFLESRGALVARPAGRDQNLTITNLFNIGAYGGVPSLCDQRLGGRRLSAGRLSSIGESTGGRDRSLIRGRDGTAGFHIGLIGPVRGTLHPGQLAGIRV